MHTKSSIFVASLLALAGATSATSSPHPNTQKFVKIPRNGIERRQAADAPPAVDGPAPQASGNTECAQSRPPWMHGGQYGARTHGRYHNLTVHSRPSRPPASQSAGEDESVYTLPLESSDSLTLPVEPTETSMEPAEISPATSSSSSSTPSSGSSSSVVSDAMPTPSSASEEAAPAPTSEVVQNAAAPDDFSKEILDAHNAARSTHAAPAMTWSDELTGLAKTWADKCIWDHDRTGQNLASATGSSQSGQAAVDMWMDEEKDYDPNNPNYSHFTQVVWKASTELGCAQSKCSNLVDKTGAQVFPNFKESVITVCNYSPAGNVIGQFTDNVTKN